MEHSMKTEVNNGKISKILDDGGSLLIRENSKNDGYFKGFLLEAEACNNPRLPMPGYFYQGD